MVKMRLVLPIVRLVEVTWPGGRQLVAGGHLLLSEKDGRKTPHPDMPEYTGKDFPVPFDEWSEDLHPQVSVKLYHSRKSRGRAMASVRASLELFIVEPVEAVQCWAARERTRR